MRMQKLTLAAGTLVIGPLLAATIKKHKDQIAAANAGQLGGFDLVQLTCDLAQAAAARVDPTITLEQVEQLVDMENFGEVLADVWRVSTPEARPGEKAAVESPSS